MLVILGALSPAPGWACLTCRPTVVQAVYDSQFAPRLLLLWLPLIVLLLGLTGAAAWRGRPRSGGRG